MGCHWHPVPSMFRVAMNTSRRSVARGRPFFWKGMTRFNHVQFIIRRIGFKPIPEPCTSILGGLVPRHALHPCRIARRQISCVFTRPLNLRLSSKGAVFVVA